MVLLVVTKEARVWIACSLSGLPSRLDTEEEEKCEKKKEEEVEREEGNLLELAQVREVVKGGGEVGNVAALQFQVSNVTESLEDLRGGGDVTSVLADFKGLLDPGHRVGWT